MDPPPPLGPLCYSSPLRGERDWGRTPRTQTARDIPTTAAPPLETSSQPGQEEEGGLQVLVRLLTPHALVPFW